MNEEVTVNIIPFLPCCNERGVELISNFNQYATEHKEARLKLRLHICKGQEDLDSLLDEGLYDYIFPEDNPHTEELKDMVKELEKNCWFLYFDRECLDL